MVTRQATGTAGGSTKHTPKQAEPAPETKPETGTVAVADRPLDDLTPEQLSHLLDLWKSLQHDEIAAHERQKTDRGHTRELSQAQLDGLAKLREPFDADKISKLPKPWCKACNAAQTRVCNSHTKIKCAKCNTWVTEAHNDLDYVGHAGITDRLLAVDPAWDWEPVTVDQNGFPLLDAIGGLWIKLTVCGLTRKGYGDAGGKKLTTNAMKEIIGDAIRNAAMRFGAGLDLWSKVDLHKESEPPAHPADQFIDSLKTEAVWQSHLRLSGVRRAAEEAGQLDYAPPGHGGVTLAEIMDEQLQALTLAAEKAAEEKALRADARKAAAAQVATEHGVNRQQSTPATSTPAQQPPGPAPAGQPDPAADAPLTAADVRASWGGKTWTDADSLQVLLNAARKNKVATEPANPEEPNGPTIGQALNRQIGALRSGNGPREGYTARAAHAAEQEQPNDHPDEHWDYTA